MAKSQLEVLLAAAAAHVEARRWPDAHSAYRAALDLAPNKITITHKLGIVAANAGDPAGALGWFDQVIAGEPTYAAAHYNRAVALLKLRRQQDAIAAFVHAAALEPDNYASHRALGFLFLAQGNRGRALDHFARTYELRRGDDRTGIARQSLEHANRSKLRHDAEQFRYLAKVRREGVRFELLARAYEAREKTIGPGIVELSLADFDMIGQDYNTAIHIAEAPEILAGAVSKGLDRQRMLRDFQQRRVTSCDDFLSERTFASLRHYLLQSTIWHDFGHIDGFVAAYLEDGLACPLLLQIADEVRGAFPELLADYPLAQAWAFKAVAPSAAVDIHADDGAISINFWMTPSAANRSAAQGGGLALCLAPPPPDWVVRGYDEDKSRAASFVKAHASDVQVTPYRENRAVLFDSHLFHWSDAPRFAEGYEDHRINLTFVFRSANAL